MSKTGPRPQEPKLPDGRMRLLWIIALLAALLMAVAMGLLAWKALHPTRAPLPSGPSTSIPTLPSAPALPEVRQQNLPQAPLPQTNVPAAPQSPVTEVTPPPLPQKAQPSGKVIWRWQLYQTNPQIMGVGIQEQTPGALFLALGVTIYNQSTESITVGNEHNEFSLNVDNRIYTSEVFSTAANVISGFSPMVPTTLAPGGTFNGQTTFVVTGRFQHVMPNWQMNLPPGVKLERVDPAQPVIWLRPASTPAPAPANQPDE